MQCSLCHEEALPDAFICHRCGALLPAQAATGTTQKLSPQDVVSCPTCNLSMAEGFLYNPAAHTGYLVGRRQSGPILLGWQAGRRAARQLSCHDISL